MNQCLKRERKLGEQRKIVEIDASKSGKRKYNVWMSLGRREMGVRWYLS